MSKNTNKCGKNCQCDENNTHFGDTNLGEDLGFAGIILSICFGIALIAFALKFSGPVNVNTSESKTNINTNSLTITNKTLE